MIKIKPEVIKILAEAEVVGNKLVLSGQLDRAAYQAVDKVIKAIGGKWDRKAGGHVFQEDAEAMVEDIINTGTYRDIKTDLQQFDSPASVVARVIELAEIMPEMMVLEPSAGMGAIALAAAEKGALVDMVELDPKRYEHLINLNIKLSGVAKPIDFLQDTPQPIYDRVVANPPFTRGQDADHITHMLKFLKPGGILVSVASPAVKFRTDKRYTAFRKLIEDNNGTIEDVAAGAFKASGTEVSTVIIKMVKA